MDMSKKIICAMFAVSLILCFGLNANARDKYGTFARYSEEINRANPDYALHQEEMTKKIQPEIDYWTKLKTCTPAKYESDNAVYKTIGLQNGVCTFEINQKDSFTKNEVPLCKMNAPIEETKEFAENKIMFAKSVIGVVRISTADSTAIMMQIEQFSRKYCMSEQNSR